LKPIATNYRDQSIANAYRLLNNLDEVQAGSDGVHIHEDLALTKVVNEAIIEAASTPAAIVSPVADEDLWHNPPSFGNDYWDCLCSRIVRRALRRGKLKG
jgi:hypothetical protein